MDDRCMFVLGSIHGWHVGCQNECENIESVRYLLVNGLVTFRIHHMPCELNGALAYELTDQGIECLERIFDAATANKSLEIRQWYRDWRKRVKEQV